MARGHPPASIQYVGSGRGLEARLVPRAGFSITLLPGRGIERRLTMANLAAAVGLLAAFVRGLALVARRRPAVVLSVGGYASLPCALAAVLLRVPLVLADSNAVPGAANRLLARFARATAVAFEGTGLPHAVVTGNPVRAEITRIDRARDRAPARRALGLPDDRVVVAVFGGSLGARRVNLALLDALARWDGRRDLAVHHVVGERDWELVRERAGAAAGTAAANGDGDSDADTLRYDAVRYEDRMDLVLAAADIAVCRAGGTTVAELAVVGLPAILVPFPGATEDHQTANARELVRAGAAVLVPDAELDGERLAREVDALAADPDRRERMAKAAAAVGRPDAAERVAALVEAHARG